MRQRAHPHLLGLWQQGNCLKTPVAMGKSMKFYTCGSYFPQRPLSREVGSWEHEVGKRSRDGRRRACLEWDPDCRVHLRESRPANSNESGEYPLKGPRRNAWKEFVFSPVPVENLGMTRVSEQLGRIQVRCFISIKENFLSGVVLAKWEIMTKAL